MPMPTVDEVLAFRDETNRVRADFLKTDLRTALTFIKIARQTSDDLRKKRSCRAARRAYETVAQLAPKVVFTERDSQMIKRGLEYLEIELQSLEKTL